MTALSVASAVYARCGALRIARRAVHDEELGQFVGAMRELTRHVDRLEEEKESAQELIRLLRRFRTRAVQSLLPTSHMTLLYPPEMRAIERLARLFASRGSIENALASRVTGALRVLSGRTTPPPVVAEVDRAQSSMAAFQIGIEHDDPAFLAAVRDLVHERWPSAHVVDARAEETLRENTPLILMGPTWLYRPSVFLAPPVSSIDVVAPGCVSDRLIDPRNSMLEGGRGTAGHWRIARTGIDELPSGGQARADPLLELREAELQRAVEMAPARTTAGEEADDELVQASLVLLAARHAVFLDYQTDTQVLLWETAVFPRFERLGVAELEPGMYFIDREPASKRTLEAVVRAQIDPERMDSLRALTQSWKDSLDERCREEGVERVARELVRLGATPARNLGNVEAWCTEACIAPQRKESFRAVLQLLGLQEAFAQLWGAAQELRSAYQSAGKVAADRLEAVLVEGATALSSLRAEGVVTVSLKEDRETRMNVYRIENVRLQGVPVPRNRTRAVFEGISRDGQTIPRVDDKSPWQP